MDIPVWRGVRSDYARGAGKLVLYLLACITLAAPTTAASATTNPADSHSVRADAPRVLIVPGLAEPLVATGPSSPEEDRALALALRTYRQPQNPALDYPLLSAPLAAFVETHPQSAWNAALLTNLGIGFYQAGYFSRAIESWRRAWAMGRHTTAPEAKVLVVSLRHDHGTQYLADDFQDEIAFLGIASSPSFVRAPEGNGCAERIIRTLKEQLLWVKSFDTIEDLRTALLAWQKLYNEHWMIERHGHRSPAQARRDHVTATQKLAA